MKKGKEQKPHIGIYGRRNNGKSSLINKIADQEIAIVSEQAGTTTDPVKKSFEITGFGPVVFIDTAGVDDEGELGSKRIDKTLRTIKTIDLAILVLAHNRFDEFEQRLIREFKRYDVPYFVVYNKTDLEAAGSSLKQQLKDAGNPEFVAFTATNSQPADPVLKRIKELLPEKSYKRPTLIGDLVSYGDIVMLITPIDIEAPAGRLILPQVQTIRDALDNDCITVVLKEREVDAFLRKTKIRPKLAITDSQIFLKADAAVPADIPLTSFSIILARMKGDFNHYLRGTPQIDKLQDGDRVMLLESCSHHVSCDDIGRVKIPRWITNFTGKKLEFDAVSGLDEFPRPITDYALVVQCGGCMFTDKQLKNRLLPAIEAGVPVSNYGMTISYVHGTYNRSIAPFVQQAADPADYL